MGPLKKINDASMNMCPSRGWKTKARKNSVTNHLPNNLYAPLKRAIRALKPFKKPMENHTHIPKKGQNAEKMAHEIASDGQSRFY